MALMVAKGQGTVEGRQKRQTAMSRDIAPSVSSASAASSGPVYSASAEVRAASDPKTILGSDRRG